MSQPRIFVSYSRKDRDITQRLVADLQKAGAEVWVDVEGIRSGNFMQAIDKALAECDWMVLILSPSALESQYVPEETYTALHRVKQGYMKGVIPVLVAQCAPGSIPPQWDVLHRYDATQDYATALAGVVHALGLAPLVSALPSPPMPGVPDATYVLSLVPEPPRLESLGFTAYRRMDGQSVEWMVPPLCDVPGGAFLMGDSKRSVSLPSYFIVELTRFSGRLSTWRVESLQRGVHDDVDDTCCWLSAGVSSRGDPAGSHEWEALPTDCPRSGHDDEDPAQVVETGRSGRRQAPGRPDHRGA
jgi:hypothetical protein